jgi:hypothetical protein
VAHLESLNYHDFWSPYKVSAVEITDSSKLANIPQFGSDRAYDQRIAAKDELPCHSQVTPHRHHISPICKLKSFQRVSNHFEPQLDAPHIIVTQ